MEGGLPAISQIGSEFGKWRLFDFSFDITSDHSFWAMFVGGIILAVATMGTDQAILQRYFTAQSERECSRSLKFFSVLLIPYNCLLILIGVFLFAFYHQNPDLARDLPQSDAVLGHFAVHQLPRFMGTLLIGAIFAASMGAMSAGINSLATCTVVDFYQRLLKPNEPDPHSVRAGRFCTVLWGVADHPWAPCMRTGWVNWRWRSERFKGSSAGVMLGIFLLGIFFRRANASGALAGTLVAMTIVTYVAFWTDISFFWYGAIGSSAHYLGRISVEYDWGRILAAFRRLYSSKEPGNESCAKYDSTTKPFRMSGERLIVNANASEGSGQWKSSTPRANPSRASAKTKPIRFRPTVFATRSPGGAVRMCRRCKANRSRCGFTSIRSSVPTGEPLGYVLLPLGEHMFDAVPSCFGRCF